MNTQERLFYESWFDALRDDVTACGGTKEVGGWFWPGKDMIAARNAVNDRLNPDRRERFDDDQERLIMRRAKEARGFSAALAFICDDAGFERPKALKPVDEAADLLRRQESMVSEFRQLLERQERLTRAPRQAVKP